MSDSSQLALFCTIDKAAKVDKVKPWYELPFLAVDVETTGLDPALNRVIELACVPFNQSNQDNNFSELFSIGEPLPAEIIKITGISDQMLSGKPTFNKECPKFLACLKNISFVVAYNAKFDRPFLESELARCEQVLPELPWVDPFIFICELDKFKKGKKLVDAASRWGVDLSNAHRALHDAKAAGDLLLKMAASIAIPSLEKLLERQKIWGWRQAQDLALYKQKNAWAISR